MNNYNYYIQFDDDNKFNGFGIQLLKEKIIYKIDKNGNKIEEKQIIPTSLLPKNAIIITSDQHDEYLSILNNTVNGIPNTKDIILVDGKITIISKYSDEELNNLQVEINRNAIKSQAQELLDKYDYKWNNPIKWAEYNNKKKKAITEYYKALRDVVNGISTVIPSLNLQE